MIHSIIRMFWILLLFLRNCLVFVLLIHQELSMLTAVIKLAIRVLSLETKMCLMRRRSYYTFCSITIPCAGTSDNSMFKSNEVMCTVVNYKIDCIFSGTCYFKCFSQKCTFSSKITCFLV